MISLYKTVQVDLDWTEENNAKRPGLAGGKGSNELDEMGASSVDPLTVTPTTLRVK
jgi:hypothetical protein